MKKNKFSIEIHNAKDECLTVVDVPVKGDACFKGNYSLLFMALRAILDIVWRVSLYKWNRP